MAGIPDSPEEDYHGAIVLEQITHDTAVIKLDFIAGIGLYKLVMGFVEDPDAVHVASALQVQLSDWVGP